MDDGFNKFEICSIVTPTWGNDLSFNLTNIFTNGLKPPTSYEMDIKWMDVVNGVLKYVG